MEFVRMMSKNYIAVYFYLFLVVYIYTHLVNIIGALPVPAPSNIDSRSANWASVSNQLICIDKVNVAIYKL